MGPMRSAVTATMFAPTTCGCSSGSGSRPTRSARRRRGSMASLHGAPAVAILEVEDGGCSMLRELRDRFGPDIPVVLVSADRTTPADVVAGLLDRRRRLRRRDDGCRRSPRPGPPPHRPHPRAPTATVDLSRLSTLTAREEPGARAWSRRAARRSRSPRLWESASRPSARTCRTCCRNWDCTRGWRLSRSRCGRGGRSRQAACPDARRLLIG